MKNNGLILLGCGLILFVCSCNENRGRTESSVKVEPVPDKPRVLEFEKLDGFLYVPTVDSVARPKIYNDVEEPAKIDSTSIDTYTFGQPLKLGGARTVGQSELRVEGGQATSLASGTLVEIVDQSPVRVNSEFFARVKVDGRLSGEIPLANIMFELRKNELVTVGYIPRREIFSTTIDSVEHSLQGDKPIKLKVIKDVAYNNLVIITKDDTMIFDGSYLSGFYDKERYDSFEAFGIKDCEISDVNHDGLIDVRIEYDHLSSFSYQGLSTGPSNFYFTLVESKIRPMFCYNLGEGEDIDYTENSVSFTDTDGTSSERGLQKVQVETTENSVSVKVVLYKMIEHSYEEQSTRSVVSLKIPFVKDLETDSVPVYSDTSDSSTLVARLPSRQRIQIRSIHYSPKSSTRFDHLWYQIDAPPGWINGNFLGFGTIE